MLLSIIIVEYRDFESLRRCLESLNANAKDLEVEVILVKNSQDEFNYDGALQISSIQMDYNAGFSRANNAGIKAARGKYVLLLNPDTEIQPSTLQNMISCYEVMDVDGKLGLLSGRILLKDSREEQHVNRNGFPGLKQLYRANPLYIKFIRNKSEGDESILMNTGEVDVVSGACTLVKREKISDELLMDEDFFLYYEDTEWSWRWKQKGYRNGYCNDAQVLHVNAGTTSKLNNRKAQLDISEMLYFYKVFSPLKFTYYVILKRINFAMDLKLTSRKKQTSLMNEILKEQKIFNNYLHTIKTNYKRYPSSAKTFLKYAEEDLA